MLAAAESSVFEMGKVRKHDQCCNIYAPDLEIICFFLNAKKKIEVSAGYQHKCVIIIIFREFNFLHNYYNHEETSLV